MRNFVAAIYLDTFGKLISMTIYGSGDGLLVPLRRSSSPYGSIFLVAKVKATMQK